MIPANIDWIKISAENRGIIPWPGDVVVHSSDLYHYVMYMGQPGVGWNDPLRPIPKIGIIIEEDEEWLEEDGSILDSTVTVHWPDGDHSSFQYLADLVTVHRAT